MFGDAAEYQCASSRMTARPCPNVVIRKSGKRRLNSSHTKKLVSLLKELFQLDQPDLDFGIYLRDLRLQIVDIALLLYYSEHSAFTRAFREQTSMAPHQARQHGR